MSGSSEHALSREPSVNALSHIGSSVLNAIKVSSLIDPTTHSLAPQEVSILSEGCWEFMLVSYC